MYKYIKASSNTHTSAYMFDFAYSTDYDSRAIEDAMYDVFSQLGLNVSSVSFDAVDYSGTKHNRPGNHTSQCYVEFTWSTNYDEAAIDADVESVMDELGYEVVGANFDTV